MRCLIESLRLHHLDQPLELPSNQVADPIIDPHPRDDLGQSVALAAAHRQFHDGDLQGRQHLRQRRQRPGGVDHAESKRADALVSFAQRIPKIAALLSGSDSWHALPLAASSSFGGGCAEKIGPACQVPRSQAPLS
jgi:hypothetical protein